METTNASGSFFSVSPDLVLANAPVPYNLYINSSAIPGRERYVRITHQDSVLSRADVQALSTKYHRLYVNEEQRGKFLQSLCRVEGADAVTKTGVLKDAAIHHLQNLFEHELTTEVLGRAVTECRDVVEGMIDVVGDCRVDQLQDLIGNLSFHDFYTYDHSINVSMYSILIYRAICPKATREEIVQAGLGGLLHDLGKTRISTEVLNFAGKLSPEMFDEIKKHPDYGKELLAGIQGTLPANIDVKAVGRVVHEHHENYDGTGYPQKLAGEQIHLLSRVITIADFFDAITTKRSYHEPMNLDDALALMANAGGKKIDPELFQCFVEQAQGMDLKKHLRKELAPEFDPCQPCNHLPLVLAARGPVAPPGSNGKIKILTNSQLRNAEKTGIHGGQNKKAS